MNRKLLFQEDNKIPDSESDFALTFQSQTGENFTKWKMKAQIIRNTITGILTYSYYGIEVDLDPEDSLYKCYEII